VKSLMQSLLKRLLGSTVCELMQPMMLRARESLAQSQKLRDQVGCLMAVDVGYREGGKVIVLVRVGTQDMVKIIDIPPKMTLDEYKMIIARLEHDFGTGPRWTDAPRWVKF
jgi:hypothetical protein